jgi:hypothetical protein
MNLLDTIGSQTTGPIGDFLSFLLDATKALGGFLNTPLGQNIAIFATGFSVLAGVLLVVGGVAARAMASFIGLTTAISGMNAEAGISTGIFAALNAQMAASGPLGAKAAAGFSAVGAAVKAIGGIAIVATLAVGLRQLAESSQEWAGSRATVQSMGKAIDGTAASYKKLINGVVNSTGIFGPSGGFLGLGNAASASRTLKPFYDFMDSVNRFNPLGALNHSLDTTGISKFRDDIKTLDSTIAGEASKNAGKAAAEYGYLSEKLKAAGYSSKEIADILPTSTAALAKHTAEVKAAAQAQDQFAAATGNSTSFVQALQEVTGLDEKGIDKWIQGYQKSIAPLTDFNSIVKSVQDNLNAAAQAQADAAGGNAKAKDFYDGTSVSLQQFTDQLNTNNQAQATWAQNLVTVATQYGPAAAQQFIDAGYSAVNSSILQQLVDATPEQAAAYIAAQQKAAQLASDATATAILTSGYVVTASGAKIGADTAKKMGDLMAQGFPIEYIMAQFNLRLAGNPLVPKANTGPAQDAISQLIRLNNGRTITLNVQANVPGGGIAGAPGRGLVPQGATGGLFTGKRFAYSSGGAVFGAGSGTSDDVPAWLSNGEYVIKASRVRQIGVPYLDALNGGRARGGSHFAGGGEVASATTMSVMELGPQSMSLMRQMVSKEMAVYLGDENIARAANRGNAKINARGGR